MTGGERDDARAKLQQRDELVDEYEMPEMIGAELRFEAVGGLALRTRHHAGIGDDHIEGFSPRE